MKEDQEVLEKAEKQGWVPKEEWKGDPDKWRPAKEFVERGENIVPILKERLGKVEKDLEMALKLNADELKAVRQQGYDQAKREYEKDMKALADKEKDAVKQGDVDEWQRIQNEKKTLKAPEPVVVQSSDDNPEFKEWHKENQWYQSDPELTEFAEFIGAKLAKEGVPKKKLYETVAQRVKTMFPEKFTNVNRDAAGIAEEGKRGGDRGGKKKFSDLPPEAKAAYSRQEKQFKAKGRTLTQEQYVKAYFEE